jgi:hypothetical protein
MSDDRSVPPPPVVRSYAAGLAERNALRAEERRNNPVFPNLSQAAVSYKPDHGAKTLGEIGAEQRNDATPGAAQQDRALRPETVEGLKALQREAAAQMEAKGNELQRELSRKAETLAPPPEGDKDKAASQPDDLVDEQFVDALRGAQEDVIQNDRERKAVAKRVGEIDLAQGLLTGEFTQVVPIIPDKLVVTYRCLTSGENNELRLLLLDELSRDPKRGSLADDLLGFYQVVASVVSLNKNTYARHMEPEGPTGRMKFNREIFIEKVHLFMSFPMPLIASLGTHGAWFDQRVRELFATTDRLKNG